MRAKRVLSMAARLVAVAVLAAGLSACDVVVSSMNASGKAQDEWSRSYPIAAQGRDEIVNQNGLVEVLAAAGDKVEVRAERIARANSDGAAKQLMQEVQIKEDVGADGIRLETVLPRGGGFRRHGEVKYHVRVPASVSVHVRNTNGQVRIDGVKGDVHAETTNGGVTFTSSNDAGLLNSRVRNTGVTVSGGTNVQLLHNAVSSITGNGIRVSSAASGHIAHNAITVSGTPMTFSYDGAGNLTSRIAGSTKWVYQWDGENRLIAVSRSDGDELPAETAGTASAGRFATSRRKALPLEYRTLVA